LLRRPGFAVTAIVILGTGIAANTAVFSVVDTVLLKPLPYPNPDRLVTVMEASGSKSERASLIAPIRLDDWNRLNRTFEAIGGSYSENVTDTTGDEPDRLVGRRVSPRYFSVFGAKPVIGRTFVPEEEIAGGPAAVVISYGLWSRRFNQGPEVIGRRLILKGEPFTVVGVMPQEFASSNIDIWLPAALAPFLMQMRDARFYSGVGRLKPGVTLAQAQDDLGRVQRDLGQQFPPTDKDWSAEVGDLKEARVGSYRESLVFILAAVTLLLVIAVANISGLMLSQLQVRERELAIRNSIGATRGQLVGTVLREVLLIAIAGVVLGLVLDVWSLRAFRSLFTDLPRSEAFHLDWRALGFASLAGVVSAILFGVWPAFRATRKDLVSVLSHTGRGIARDSRSQHVLVAGQFALSVLLLSGTGLMLRSYYNLQHVELGFDPSHDVTFHVGAAWNEDRNRVGQLQKALVQRFERIPGVVAAGFSNFLPASSATLRSQIRLRENARTDEAGLISVGERSIGGAYTSALSVPILAGTTCPQLEKLDTGTPKALVNRRFGELYGNGQNLVGQHFHWTQDSATTPETEIVGVVGDIREDNLRSTPVPYVYSCLPAGGWPDPEYVVRAQGSPQELSREIRAAVHDVDPTRAIFGMQPLQQELDSTLEQTRLQMGLISMFGGAAIFLAAIGLYGLITLAVTARTKEIGIRLALGAAPRRIVSDVVMQVVWLLGLGTAVGLVLVFAVQRELGSVVFGVSPLDPTTLAAALGVLVIAATLATYLPARRAAKVDPLTAMRD